MFNLNYIICLINTVQKIYINKIIYSIFSKSISFYCTIFEFVELLHLGKALILFFKKCNDELYLHSNVINKYVYMT